MNEFATELEMIRRVLENSLAVRTYINSFGSHLYNIDGIITTVVIAPHEGNEYKWVLRLSPAVSFDRWANSSHIEECFESANDMREYLYRMRLVIYAQLFEILSDDYDELKLEYDEARENYAG